MTPQQEQPPRHNHTDDRFQPLSCGTCLKIGYRAFLDGFARGTNAQQEQPPLHDDAYRSLIAQALQAGPIYAGPGSPLWDALWAASREGRCRGEFVPFDGWRWTR